MAEWLQGLKSQFILNFVEGDRWKNITIGLENTIIITLAAAIIGVLLGLIIAAIRTTYDKNREIMQKKAQMSVVSRISYTVVSVLNAISKLYVTVVRGIPMVVQLLVMYFIIFASSTNGVMVAIIAFGLNSAAYVSEIFRGGIMSIDDGQFEAGRAMGFNYLQTMLYIIIPQVFKNVLPTLLNEFIALLKETSVAGYVGIQDLTRGGNIIRGVTFSAFMPLIAVALIYLVLVTVLTYAVGKLERRLRKSER